MRQIRFAADPVLLTNADYYGTLAAARSLGRLGIPVTVAHDSRMGAASWSRFVHRSVGCPPAADSRAFLSWLLEFGADAPGHVLYPTSDDTAFIYSAHRDELLKYFHLYQPPVEAIYALLNKRRLYAEAVSQGLQTPRTWFPETETDFEQIRREASGPLMIKPVTQILFSSHRKGDCVPSNDHLMARYRAFANESFAPEVVMRDPGVVRPMVQEFHPNAATSIYALTGFITPRGEAAMRGATKLLQLPRRLGVGICFEAAPVDPVLAEGIVTICRHVGYYGVFEAEFIVSDEQPLLIDFNPRFYGQMGFELGRGLPLVQLAYEATLGHSERVTKLLRAANEPQPDAPVYCHRAALDLVLRSQQVARVMPATEARGWRSWLRTNASIDAVLDDDDWAPAAVDFVSRWSSYARHPRSFVRAVVLNR